MSDTAERAAATLRSLRPEAADMAGWEMATMLDALRTLALDLAKRVDELEGSGK